KLAVGVTGKPTSVITCCLVLPIRWTSACNMLNTVSGPVRSSRIMSGCTSMPMTGFAVAPCWARAGETNSPASDAAVRPALNSRRSIVIPSSSDILFSDREGEIAIGRMGVDRKHLPVDAIGAGRKRAHRNRHLVAADAGLAGIDALAGAIGHFD